jgi:hypothetical protein
MLLMRPRMAACSRAEEKRHEQPRFSATDSSETQSDDVYPCRRVLLLHAWMQDYTVC